MRKIFCCFILLSTSGLLFANSEKNVITMILQDAASSDFYYQYTDNIADMMEETFGVDRPVAIDIQETILAEIKSNRTQYHDYSEGKNFGAIRTIIDKKLPHNSWNTIHRFLRAVRAKDADTAKKFVHVEEGKSFKIEDFDVTAIDNMLTNKSNRHIWPEFEMEIKMEFANGGEVEQEATLRVDEKWASSYGMQSKLRKTANKLFQWMVLSSDLDKVDGDIKVEYQFECEGSHKTKTEITTARKNGKWGVLAIDRAHIRKATPAGGIGVDGPGQQNWTSPWETVQKFVAAIEAKDQQALEKVAHYKSTRKNYFDVKRLDFDINSDVTDLKKWVSAKPLDASEISVECLYGTDEADEAFAMETQVEFSNCPPAATTKIHQNAHKAIQHLLNDNDWMEYAVSDQTVVGYKLSLKTKDGKKSHVRLFVDWTGDKWMVTGYDHQ
ncbi:hypothetical protein [Candidatus Uabimicrobium amorphum]|uniref:PepSY domain-containing protein n=1 Tax=Uabimicrobium amorphum TaxID=2596890 RepID=A0A5S9F511_UABAM|nr:hypothetical protein [Candidatus Uabimicrobium amorphum]BBM86377.1 hypothetical protein UABAM_04763 [Candidatus Uabimicrobium amorphum]